MQPEERFAKIEAILQAMAERMVQADRRMDRSEQRMDRAEKRMEKVDRRMEKFDERIEKFDQRLEVTRKLVQVGMKLVIQNNVQLKELQRAQAAFLDSLRKGGTNGHKR
jgi:DNA repair exonuclease SbcCD ATPase subunit